MALVSDDLAALLHTFRQQFNNKTISQIIADYGSVANAQLLCIEGEEEIRVNYWKANADLRVPGLGLMAGATAVTGISTTGEIL